MKDGKYRERLRQQLRCVLRIAALNGFGMRWRNPAHVCKRGNLATKLPRSEWPRPAFSRQFIVNGMV